jgi:hypothetical protein
VFFFVDYQDIESLQLILLYHAHFLLSRILFAAQRVGYHFANNIMDEKSPPLELRGRSNQDMGYARLAAVFIAIV